MGPMQRGPRLDEIGYWSEIKLDILREYAAAYSRILAARRQPALHHVYIDAFAGGGVHVSRATREPRLGSPLIALGIKPPFREFHFVDLDPRKIALLRQRIGPRNDVFYYEDDANSVLPQQVFPRVKYKDYRRGLCILDPYGLHLSWNVILAAGQMKSIDLFVNFPVLDMNRNVLWHDVESVAAEQSERLTYLWGDESWREEAYSTAGNLFGYPERESIEVVASAFRKRLKKVAGFARVPEPMPMRNTKGAIVYYLFFASQNEAGQDIVRDIFNKYRDRGAS
ncbi:MAG TPA: three-Cys-motif partner protein TcmP [Terriglobia bacterium]|nr:three-Cys-motif partner protein TcmP [Terriglobia bacterium]